MYIPALLIALTSSRLTATQALMSPSPLQQSAPPVLELQSHPDWPKARPEDVRTVRAIVDAFFHVISAPAGGILGRDGLRSLFVPGGRIEVPIVPSSTKSADVLFLTPDQYADNSDSQTTTSGFFDHMLALQVQRFGVMAHAYSSYESRKSVTDVKPFVRGVKSFELLKSKDRWFIVQVSWDRERPDNVIPARYLHNADF